MNICDIHSLNICDIHTLNIYLLFTTVVATLTWFGSQLATINEYNLWKNKNTVILSKYYNQVIIIAKSIRYNVLKLWVYKTSCTLIHCEYNENKHTVILSNITINKLIA